MSNSSSDDDYCPVEGESEDTSIEDSDTWTCTFCTTLSSHKLKGKYCNNCMKGFCDWHSYPFRDMFYHGCQKQGIFVCRECWDKSKNKPYCPNEITNCECIVLSKKIVEIDNVMLCVFYVLFNDPRQMAVTDYAQKEELWQLFWCEALGSVLDGKITLDLLTASTQLKEVEFLSRKNKLLSERLCKRDSLCKKLEQQLADTEDTEKKVMKIEESARQDIIKIRASAKQEKQRYELQIERISNELAERVEDNNQKDEEIKQKNVVLEMLRQEIAKLKKEPAEVISQNPQSCLVVQPNSTAASTDAN